ncbi:MAG: right-handed parallel beta-helix repeat-containing protein [Deltaproteobacteria bacterium]|nr:right-handed parallel beta-helix repeat-containing protein [Deltaproteobacteria bacterium]
MRLKPSVVVMLLALILAWSTDCARFGFDELESSPPPNPAVALRLTGIPPSSSAGDLHTLHVEAVDQHGDVVVSFSGGVTFGCSDPQATLPLPYVFGTADAGVASFPEVSLRTVGSHSIFATHASVEGSLSPIEVIPGPVDHFLVDEISWPCTRDDLLGLRVRAFDGWENLQTAYEGSVELSSSDAGATLVQTLTFTPSDQGERRANDALRFTELGSHWVEVRDGAATGRMEGILVTAHHVFRSMGYENRSPLVMASTDNLLSISELISTFDQDLPPNVGVGDALQYDSNGDGSIDAIAFIRWCHDSRTFVVRAADDGPPLEANPTATWSLCRAYISLYDAQAGIENNHCIPDNISDFDTWSNGTDLLALDQTWNIACYADAPHPIEDSAPLEFEYWTGDEEHYLRIFTPALPSEVGQSQRHSGRWDPSAFWVFGDGLADMDSYSEPLVSVTSPYVRIEGLQCQENDAACISVSGPGTASDIRISANIVRGGDADRGIGIIVRSPDTKTRIWNNLIYNTSRSAGDGIWLRMGARAIVYNNTVYNSHRGIYVWSYDASTMILKNNLILGNVFGGDSGAWDIASVDPGFELGSTNNCTSDDSGGNLGLSNSQIDIAPAEVFVDADNGDFRQLPTSPCLNMGADLSEDPLLVPTTDLIGAPRPGSDGWDVGAFQQ